MHRISRSRNSVSPTGRPFAMFHLPEVYGTRDYMCRLSSASIKALEDLCLFSNLPCDSEVCDLAVILMNENQLTVPTDCMSAVNTYITLRSKMMSVIYE